MPAQDKPLLLYTQLQDGFVFCSMVCRWHHSHTARKSRDVCRRYFTSFL